MKLPAFWIRSIVGVASVLMALSACMPQKRHDPSFVKDRNDLHERLSTVIARDGFSHGIRSQRDGLQDFDSVYIHVALDSLKRRHYSLDNLMKDIGVVCALPNYAHLAIRIEIGAGDAEDQAYLKAGLRSAIEGRSNITVVMTQDAYNDITITVNHPGQLGLPDRE